MALRDPRNLSRTAALAILGGVALVVAAVLPWSTAAGETLLGLAHHSDAFVTAGAGVVVAAAPLVMGWRRRVHVLAVAAGLAALFLGAHGWYVIAADPASEPASGLALTAVAGVLVATAGVAGRLSADDGGGGLDGAVDGAQTP